MSRFFISLDFEMFWGVADSRSLENYGQNIYGVWEAIPKILALFSRYDIHATWATVGMLMCRDFAQWNEIRPSLLPTYERETCSNYRLRSIVKENPKLFFARPLVNQILNTQNQELASHTYSHFYCGEAGATTSQFDADLECASFVAQDVGVQFKSIVLPRNQVLPQYLNILPKHGFLAYRGNPNHFLYRNGHVAPAGIIGRTARFIDSWIPLSGQDHTKELINESNNLVNIPASLFLRPYSRTLSTFEKLRIIRVKNAMTVAAKTKGNFHLWWHPHNFGLNVEQNLTVLESILKHYLVLQDLYGMQNMTMKQSLS